MSIKWISNKNLGYDAIDGNGILVGILEHLSDNSWGASIRIYPENVGAELERLDTRGYSADEAKEIFELEWERRKNTLLYR